MQLKVFHPIKLLNWFEIQAQLLMIVHHKNLVSLVGYCDEGAKKALIYEYMANGNLLQHLSGIQLFTGHHLCPKALYHMTLYKLFLSNEKQDLVQGKAWIGHHNYIQLALSKTRAPYRCNSCQVSVKYLPVGSPILPAIIMQHNNGL